MSMDYNEIAAKYAQDYLDANPSLGGVYINLDHKKAELDKLYAAFKERQKQKAEALKASKDWSNYKSQVGQLKFLKSQLGKLQAEIMLGEGKQKSLDRLSKTIKELELMKEPKYVSALKKAIYQLSGIPSDKVIRDYNNANREYKKAVAAQQSRAELRQQIFVQKYNQHKKQDHDARQMG